MRLVLFQPEIAQNAGAATRAAACFGAGLDIISPCGFPLSAKTFTRVAMDYGLLAPPHVHDDWAAFQAVVPGRRILLTTKAEVSLWDFSFAADDLLIMGQESAGAPDYVHAAADATVRIPLAAAARSLNMAMAAAIALAEAQRQVHAAGAADALA